MTDDWEVGVVLWREKIYSESHLPLQKATAVIESKRCNYLSKEDITQCVCKCVRMGVCEFDIITAGKIEDGRVSVVTSARCESSPELIFILFKM